MLYDLVNCGADRNPSLDTQPASHFPWLALHPPNLAELVAVTPPLGININGENRLQGTVQHDLKIERLHGVGVNKLAGRILAVPAVRECRRKPN
jgi:hypothetical protein